MRSAKLHRRFIAWFVACGVLPALVSCTGEEPSKDPIAAGTGGSSAATGGAAGTGGSGGASVPAAGTSSGAGSGGAAGAGAGGAAGAATGGTGAGNGGMGGTVGGAAAGGASGASGSAGSSAAGIAGAAGSGSGAGGASGAAGGGSGTSGSGSGGTGSGAFTLTSPNHMEGAVFGDKYTCAMAGFNGSLLPELNWTAGPAGTMSYAITFIDVTLTKGQPPNELGYHWVIWNIPSTTQTLPEEFKDQASVGAMENRDYLGPCPNAGGGSANTDTYEFTIYALSQESITISGSGTDAVKDAETKLEMMNLAKAKLTGTSSASP
jgi:phosphatidylethanolamine-binding protein (PEBP) family uncharacterized protein